MAQSIRHLILCKLWFPILVKQLGSVAIRYLVEVVPELLSCCDAVAQHLDFAAGLLLHLTLGSKSMVLGWFNAAAGELVIISLSGFDDDHLVIASSYNDANSRAFRIMNLRALDAYGLG